MSHFVVAVFHREDQDVDELLMPYDENLEVEPYVLYTKEEAIDFAKSNYNLEGKTDEECWEFMTDGFKTDDEGNIYSSYNPNAKWDYYCVGGRWSGMLKTKNGEADEARVKDIDFTPNQKSYERALRFWDVIVEGKPKKEDENFFTIYKPEYYADIYGDRETYAKAISSFQTFAVILPDGTWLEEGHMGCFGISSSTSDDVREWSANYKKNFIDTADPEWILSIVDCHI